MEEKVDASLKTNQASQHQEGRGSTSRLRISDSLDGRAYRRVRCVGLLNTVCCRGSCGTGRRCMIGAVFGYSFALLACAFLYLCSNSLNSALRNWEPLSGTNKST